MIYRAAVIDTNVVVAGLITRDREAPTARILNGMLGGAFVFLLSPALLAEYREVLARDAVRRFHGLSDEELDAVLTALAESATVREPPPARAQGPDPNDQHLWELCAVEPQTVLVSGDERLVEQPPPGVQALPPREFVETLIRT